MNHFSIVLWCAMKSGFYRILSNDRLSGWTEKLESTFQSQTCTKKKDMSLLGDLLSVWSTTAFWIPYMWEVCAANWWDAPKTAIDQKALVNRKDPILLHDNDQQQVAQPTLQELNELGYEVLLHLSYSSELLPVNCHFFKFLNNFLWRNPSTTSRRRKMLSKNSSNPET